MRPATAERRGRRRPGPGPKRTRGRLSPRTRRSSRAGQAGRSGPDQPALRRSGKGAPEPAAVRSGRSAPGRLRHRSREQEVLYQAVLATPVVGHRLLTHQRAPRPRGDPSRKRAAQALERPGARHLLRRSQATVTGPPELPATAPSPHASSPKRRCAATAPPSCDHQRCSRWARQAHCGAPLFPADRKARASLRPVWPREERTVLRATILVPHRTTPVVAAPR
jgi:hypothetical protein